MDFQIKKHESPHKKRYIKEDLDIAYAFAKKTYTEFGKLIKAMVLFGATARKTHHQGGDIDILIVLDDVGIALSQNVVQTYRVITQKIVNDVSTRVHVTTLKLSTFWEYIRQGDPVAVNILRDGVALVDTGWFDPLQVLLYQGKIHPSKEAVYAYFGRTKPTVLNSKWHIMQAVIDLYWAVIDASHAALMSRHQVPPGPEHVADMLEKVFVKEKMLDTKYPRVMRHFYKVTKMIIHRELKEITGSEYDTYLKEATEYIAKMEELITFQPRKSS